ncbi:glycosyltransferase family 2 protein [Aquicella lusitana]|nr:glycosyltransferase family 2 protein [Aquicella lusitana]
MTAIMPNYNSAEFFPKSIQALLDQTEAFDEIIIVDDGSTDNSVALLEAIIKEHPQIRLIRHEKNQGVNAAVNTGLKHATGEFIIFCAADDWFSPHIVALAKQAASKFPTVGLICGDAIVQRFDLKQPFYRMLPYPPDTFLTPDEFKAITRKSYVGFNSAGGMFMNRQALLNAGIFYSETRWHADWLMYFVVALRQGIYYFNEVFIHINVRKLSYSEGKGNTKIQNQVMLDTVHLIAEKYPDLWDDFKKAALVPHHAIRYIALFLMDPLARRFITKRFVWKMMINNHMIYRIGRLFPYRFILRARRLLRA